MLIPGDGQSQNIVNLQMGLSNLEKIGKKQKNLQKQEQELKLEAMPKNFLIEQKRNSTRNKINKNLLINQTQNQIFYLKSLSLILDRDLKAFLLNFLQVIKINIILQI